MLLECFMRFLIPKGRLHNLVEDYRLSRNSLPLTALRKPCFRPHYPEGVVAGVRVPVCEQERHEPPLLGQPRYAVGRA